MLLCVAGFTTLCAQSVTDSTRFSETMWSMKKKKMVLEYMQLTEGEKASFWPLYESYSNAIRYMEMESMELLQAYHSLEVSRKANEMLDKFSKRILQNELMIAKVRKQYYKKFSKALSPGRAGQFMQFDDTLRTLLHMEARTGAPEPDTHASIRRQQ